MATIGDYQDLKKVLNNCPMDIEPYCFRPRLTRRWWDHEFIDRSEKEGEEEARRASDEV